MTDENGFITLPPGIFDPSTLKSPPRPERPKPPRDDIVFVPMVPGMAPPAPAAPLEATEITAHTATAVPAWTLELPDGAHADVRRRLVVGRNPVVPEQWAGAASLALADTTHSVSKTHAVFETDDSGLWVNDLNSTNGVWVVNGGDVTEALAGRRVRVPDGATVELGDYLITARRS